MKFWKHVWAAILVVLVLALPGVAALSYPWAGFPVFGPESGAYPIRLVGVDQKDNIAIVTWDVPTNCLSGMGTVLMSKDGHNIAESVNLGRLKPWGKKVAVVVQVREPLYVKLRIIAGNGVFMSSWVKLTPDSRHPYTPTGEKGVITPQLFPGLALLIVAGLTLWDAYDTYKTCKNYGIDSMECKVQGTFFVVGLALPGDEGIKLVKKGATKIGVTSKIYRVLKNAKIIDNADNVLTKFTHIFDDIAKYGDDAADALDNLLGRGITSDAIENTVKHGVTLKALREGIEKADRHFSRKFSTVWTPLWGSAYKVGDVSDSMITIPRGNERMGLIHSFLRHIWGYEAEVKPMTSFWPIGQRVTINGKTLQMPKVFKDEGEVAEFASDVLQRALKLDKYRGQFTSGRVVLDVDLSDVGIYKPGIDSVTYVFACEGRTCGLITMYPNGPEVVIYKRFGG
ncbi:hypothetical protein ADU37_CDS07380 [Thermococcus sp. 2319x1]|uniref:hypothetical protein n=1 Tax=Thermococcus sp. 2319x1 TaxID=1674923 RepID=UPI00073A6F55|nr:hypothetical protein [Thermococcus sp. 2319x1]ALV62437.1 hypothetical protein ADU37_CDS07380 [Thermococcus sp. 2319x1]